MYIMQLGIQTYIHGREVVKGNERTVMLIGSCKYKSSDLEEDGRDEGRKWRFG
jgi:hypothetical protein